MHQVYIYVVHQLQIYSPLYFIQCLHFARRFKFTTSKIPIPTMIATLSNPISDLALGCIYSTLDLFLQLQSRSAFKTVFKKRYHVIQNNGYNSQPRVAKETTPDSKITQTSRNIKMSDT